MKSVDQVWKTGALFICTKCGKSISSEGLKDPSDVAENLKKYLKAQMKEKGLSQEIRVMTSSCLDICEPEFQAISYVPAQSGITENFIIHPENDREDVLKFLIEKTSKL